MGFALIGPTSFADPDPRIASELHSFYVDPDSFRQRIGTRLHEACVRVSQTLPTTMARLWVMDYNQRARAFYARQGWQPDGHHRPDNPALLDYRLIIRPTDPESGSSRLLLDRLQDSDGGDDAGAVVHDRLPVGCVKDYWMRQETAASAWPRQPLCARRPGASTAVLIGPFVYLNMR